jgi:hypothetical protein
VTGAVATTLGAGAGGGGGIVVPGPLAWSNIFDVGAGSTDTQTLTAITTPISISATLSGGGTAHSILNGSAAFYAGAFSVSAGDALAWLIVNAGPIAVAGTVTVANQSDGGAVLDTFTYTVKGGS